MPHWLGVTKLALLTWPTRLKALGTQVTKSCIQGTSFFFFDPSSEPCLCLSIDCHLRLITPPCRTDDVCLLGIETNTSDALTCRLKKHWVCSQMQSPADQAEALQGLARVCAGSLPENPMDPLMRLLQVTLRSKQTPHRNQGGLKRHTANKTRISQVMRHCLLT